MDDVKENGFSVENCTISFQDLSYLINIKDPTKRCCGTITKRIISNVDGICKPGAMNAILGPTGSGKTTLLDLLSGRKDTSGLTGKILLNGKPQPKNFKCMTGYVVQEDVVVGTLTVRENLMFSANLRLPSTVTTADKKQRVEDIVFELGMGHCVDSKVGNAMIRGISGGEKKRTTIGMELITSPSVLFLDEPTSGLDASTAKAVLLLLHRLSRKGRTIIFSIHQPRYSIFKLFDCMTLLSRGVSVYHGPADQALGYFKSIGYERDENENPADFFLDIINGDSTALRDKTHSTIYTPSEEKLNGHTEIVKLTIDSDGDEDELHEKLGTKFRNSSIFGSLQHELEDIDRNSVNSSDSKHGIELDIGYPTSFLTQTWYLSMRFLISNLRNPVATRTKIAVNTIMGLLAGVLFLQVDNSLKSGIQNRTGAFFFIVFHHVFCHLAAADIFIKERLIFVHEHASGYYRISSYLIAKILAGLLPLMIPHVVLYCPIAYFMIGLRANVLTFLSFCLNILLTAVTSCSVVFFASCSSPNFPVANIICIIIFVYMMVLSGLLVNLDSVGAWLTWSKFISIPKYSYYSCLISELAGMEFCETASGNGTGIQHCHPNAGNAYLESQGIPYSTYWDYWQNQLALVIIAVIMFCLSYIQMRRIKYEK